MKLFALFFIVLLIGCEKPSAERHYTEVVIESPLANAPFAMQNPHEGMDMSAAPMMATANEELKGKIAWSVPQGWQEEKGSGMRMATFRVSSDPDEIDCSIVSLGGSAGGLQANLSRWMQQIGLDISSDTLNDFINAAPKISTKAGAEARLFDFTILQSGDPSAKSTIAAVLTVADATLFIKMTGTIEAVLKNKESFISLVKSIYSNE